MNEVETRKKEIYNSAHKCFETLGIADIAFLAVDLDGKAYYSFRIGSEKQDFSNTERMERFVGLLEEIKMDILALKLKLKSENLADG